MDSATSIFRSLRRYRSYFWGVGLAISLLLPELGFGQATETKNESLPDAGDDALIPLTGGAPLTAREEEMLRLIKGLQERVARLEARGTLDSGGMKPAAQEGPDSISQAKLLEASIVGAAPQRTKVSEKAADPASVQATAGAKQATVSVKDEQAAQSNQSNADDKTAFPESSNGNPAIFGEFNPGRGFTVGRGEYGERRDSCTCLQCRCVASTVTQASFRRGGRWL